MKTREGLLLPLFAGAGVAAPVKNADAPCFYEIKLNISDVALWKKLRNKSAADGLTWALRREYEVEKQAARKGSEDFINQLLEADCLE